MAMRSRHPTALRYGIYVKRDLQKRPIPIKRDLKKRPINDGLNALVPRWRCGRGTPRRWGTAYMKKETYTRDQHKKLKSIKRDPCQSKEAYTRGSYQLKKTYGQSRHMCHHEGVTDQKRTTQEAYINKKRPAKKALVNQTRPTGNGDMYVIMRASRIQNELQKRRISKETYKRDLHEGDTDRKTTTKEANITEKRPISLKRDLHQSKETYINQKRPTSIKRDLHQSKETYINQKRPTSIKRDLHQ